MASDFTVPVDIDGVAHAIAEHLDPGSWEEMEGEDRQGVIDTAIVASVATLKSVVEAGFRIIPPDRIPIPKSDEEAAAMMTAVKAYGDRQRRSKLHLVSTPGLIVPDAVQ